MTQRNGTVDVEVSVADFKAAAEKIGADWRSSGVQMGVMDGAAGRKRANASNHDKKWMAQYKLAFEFGEALVKARVLDDAKKKAAAAVAIVAIETTKELKDADEPAMDVPAERDEKNPVRAQSFPLTLRSQPTQISMLSQLAASA